MLARLAGTGVLLWFALGAVLFARYVAGSAVGTSLNILVNSVGGETVKKHRGTVNGIAMSVSGIARALAPAVGGSMFAWSNNNGLEFPLNHYFVFEVGAVCLLFMFALLFLGMFGLFSMMCSLDDGYTNDEYTDDEDVDDFGFAMLLYFIAVIVCSIGLQIRGKKAFSKAKKSIQALIDRNRSVMEPLGLRWNLPTHFPYWIELCKDYQAQTALLIQEI